MLFTFFLVFALQTRNEIEYKSLIDKARSSVKTLRKLKSSERVENSYEPGIYNFENGSVHFRLLKKLTSPTSNDIEGYAVQNGKIAIIHTSRSTFSFDENTVFIQPPNTDNKEKKLLLLSNSIYNDNDADVYNFQEVNLFSVFSDLSFEKEFHTLQKKENDGTVTYEKAVNGNWNEETNLPSLIDVNTFHFGLGSYLSADISARFSLPSIINPTLDFSISFSGDAGALLKIHDFAIQSLTLFEKEIKLAGVELSILGLDINFGIFFDINGYLEDISIDLPYELNFYKGYNIKFSKDIIVTIDGIKESPSIIDVQINSDTPTFENIEELINQISFTITPILDIGFRASLEFDVLISTSLKFGLNINFPFSYRFDTSACVFPYLYGAVPTIIKGYIQFGGLTLFSLDLIDEHKLEMEFFNNKARIRDTCLYNPEKTNEGDESLIVERSPQKIVFTLDSIDKEKGFDDIFGQVRIVSKSDQNHVIGMITTKWLKTKETKLSFYLSSITTETINDISVQCNTVYYDWLNDIKEYTKSYDINNQKSKDDYSVTTDTNNIFVHDYTTFKGSVIKTFAHEFGKLCSISDEYSSGDYYALITIPEETYSRDYVLFEYDTDKQEYIGNAENVEYYDSTNLNNPRYDSYSVDDKKFSLKLTFLDLIVGSDSFVANFTANDITGSIILTDEWDPKMQYSAEELGYQDWEFIFSINSQNENASLELVISMKKDGGWVDLVQTRKFTFSFQDIKKNCQNVDEEKEYIREIWNEKGDKHFGNIFFNIKRVLNQVLVKIPHEQSMRNQYILIPKYPLNYYPGNAFFDDPLVYYLDETYFEIEPTDIGSSQKQSYSLFYSPDANPLQKHYIVDIGWYLIPITNNDAKVGFRKTGIQERKIRMGYYGQVVGYENMDSTNTIHYSPNNKISMIGENSISSCIFVNKSLLDSYDICYTEKYSYFTSNVEVKKYSFTDCSYGIIYVYSDNEITLNAYQRIYEISENESYIIPDLSTICNAYSYEKSINSNMIIKCKRANSIIYTLLDGLRQEISTKDTSSDAFEIPFRIAKSVERIQPVCQNPESKNCIIKKELNPDLAYMVKYNSREGVIEESNILGGGFYSEIIHDTTNLQFTKSWNGEVIFEPLYKVDNPAMKSILSDSTIKYIRKIEGDNCTIKFQYNEIDIPISRVQLENDPDSLMKSIGIKEYNPRYVIINEYGQISCPLSYLTEFNVESLYDAINLPKSYSNSVNIEDDFIVESSSSEGLDITLESSSSEYTTSFTDEYTTSSTDEKESISSDYPSSSSHISQISNEEEGSYQKGDNTNQPSGVNSTVIIIVAVVVIVVIAAAVVVGFIIYKKKKESSNQENGEEKIEEEVDSNEVAVTV